MDKLANELKKLNYLKLTIREEDTAELLDFTDVPCLPPVGSVIEIRRCSVFYEIRAYIFEENATEDAHDVITAIVKKGTLK